MKTAEERRLARNAASRKAKAKLRSTPEGRAKQNDYIREWRAKARLTAEGKQKEKDACKRAYEKLKTTPEGQAKLLARYEERRTKLDPIKANEASRLSCQKARATVSGTHAANMRVLKYKFKLTETEFQEMMNHQKGCCAICGKDFGSLTQRADVDHSHTTDKIRGLLCNTCNTSVGKVEILDPVKTSDYLNKPVSTIRYTFTNTRGLVENKQCEICGSTSNLRVDHNHTSGYIRGILCNRCNIAVEVIESAMFPEYIEYLHAV